MIPATADHTAALFDGIASVYDRVNTADLNQEQARGHIIKCRLRLNPRP